MRPLLRPGTHLLRRSDGAVQLGLDPRHAVVLDDSPGLRGVLLGSEPAGPEIDGLHVDGLRAAGLLVEEREVRQLLGDRDGPVREGRAALVRQAGPDAVEAAAARARCRVEVVAFGHPCAQPLAAGVQQLVAASGLSTAQRPVRAPDGSRGRRTTVGVLVGVGEPDRRLTDPWVRDLTPHLVVRVTEGRTVVGPFVVPGATACLRCIDAHHTDADPEWPLLLWQYTQAASRDRADGSPEPVDPALAALAVAWAARDLAVHAEGRRPSSWSSTLALGDDLGSVEGRAWLRHPECGCSWA